MVYNNTVNREFSWEKSRACIELEVKTLARYSKGTGKLGEADLLLGGCCADLKRDRRIKLRPTWVDMSIFVDTVSLSGYIY